MPLIWPRVLQTKVFVVVVRYTLTVGGLRKVTLWEPWLGFGYTSTCIHMIAVTKGKCFMLLCWVVACLCHTCMCVQAEGVWAWAHVCNCICKFECEFMYMCVCAHVYICPMQVAVVWLIQTLAATHIYMSQRLRKTTLRHHQWHQVTSSSDVIFSNGLHWNFEYRK
jgi:hypothetical protein